MASSPVDVCNMALQLLGARPIASLTEGTKTASICNQFYADERDAAFRAHPWKCAKARQQLAKDSTAPIFGWASSFQLPTNPYCLRVLALDVDAAYTIEGRKLLTDASAVKALFVARIESPSEWDALYTSTFAARLAMTMAYPLTELANLQKQMFELYREKLAEARSIDSQEGSTQDSGNDLLIDVRGGGRFFNRRSGWTMEA